MLIEKIEFRIEACITKEDQLTPSILNTKLCIISINGPPETIQ